MDGGMIAILLIAGGLALGGVGGLFVWLHQWSEKRRVADAEAAHFQRAAESGASGSTIVAASPQPEGAGRSARPSHYFFMKKTSKDSSTTIRTYQNSF